MLFAARVFSYFLVSIAVGSFFLLPGYTQTSQLPNLISLQKIEENLGRIQKTNPKAIVMWRAFQSMLMEEYAALSFEKIPEEEMGMIFKSIQTLAMPILKSVLAHSSKQIEELSNYERYLIFQMLRQSLGHLEPGSMGHTYLSHLAVKLEKFEKTPYEYLKGKAVEKRVEGEVKILSWNTSLLPGRLAQYIGGQSPWYQRVELIAEILQAQKADVICLQEVHAEPAALALYEALKDQYAHFYCNMGPKIMASQMSDIGLNSGLFIASKLPLTEVHFEVFKHPKGQKEVNKGFFFAKIKGSELAFVTSHLDPFNEPPSQEVRYEEMQKMLAFLNTKSECLKILTGDLNIPWGSGEPAETLLKTYFFDPYNKNRLEISQYSRTFSDRFVSHEGNGSSEILDYFLILQTPGFEKYAVITERVEGFDEVLSKSAASDHHALLSQVIFPRELKESRERIDIDEPLQR